MSRFLFYDAFICTHMHTHTYTQRCINCIHNQTLTLYISAPIFQFSTGSTTIGEGSQGTGTVELTNWVANSPDTSVKISSANVDATSAKDYVSVSETLSFSGTASKTFNIITTQDTVRKLFNPHLHREFQ